MKPFSFSRILPFASFFMALCAIMFMAATHPPPSWQPPLTDETIHGDGTREDVMGLQVPIVYSGTITQASTSAPTALELYNGIDDTAFAYTRDSIGSYKIEGSDTAFADSTFQYMISLGTSAATAVGAKVWRVNDSLLLFKVYRLYGQGVDLAGKANLLIIKPYQEE